ncbi:hypothetical protein [Lentzea kentuckyensis]|uniref:hypothetical protein n=1 Tax=Lentzea kentuckyensis TaxID=360086 RepID=UPI001179C13F|nr:hypothetical protein [Lentzea kentuckyensis]
MFSRRLTALACALLTAGAMTVSGAGAASAEPVGVQGLPTFLGVKLIDESNNGQCVGPAAGTWVTNPNQTASMRLDTDNRSGGCQLSFGIGDIDGSLAGLHLTYQLSPHNGSHSGQCEGYWGENDIPVGSEFKFGNPVRVDSDSRPGWCDLTFRAHNRPDVLLEVKFTAENSSNQCLGASDAWQPVTIGLPVVLGIDTDGRPGGCGLALRLTKY